MEAKETEPEAAAGNEKDDTEGDTMEVQEAEGPSEPDTNLGV